MQLGEMECTSCGHHRLQTTTEWHDNTQDAVCPNCRERMTLIGGFSEDERYSAYRDSTGGVVDSDDNDI